MWSILDKNRFAEELVELSNVQDDTLLYKMPKKPLTAYMFFVRETRTRVAQQMPEIPPLDIMKEVGKIWQRQTENDLKRFRQQAKLDVLRYQAEMEKFIGMLNRLRADEKVVPKIVEECTTSHMGANTKTTMCDATARA